MKFHKQDMSDVELNLTPIMNMFVTIIPLLLISATFFSISVLNASYPGKGDGKSIKTAKKITALVVVKNSELELKAISDNVPEKELKNLKFHIGKVDNKHDYQKLNQILFNMKSQYLGSDTIIILPEKNVKYDTLIKIMDNSRKYKDSTKTLELFPNVVISTVKT